MEKFCILIPTINRYDLLSEALAVYPELYPDIPILLLDSGNQNIPYVNNYEIFHALQKMGVAESWNYLIKMANSYGYSHYLILNDDIVLKCGKSAIEKLIDFWNPMTFIRTKPIYHWSAYILNKTIIDKVGYFDENFEKCFFEDNDYEYRMKLAGVKIEYSETLTPDIYRNSMTTQKDPSLGDYISNREYYIRKWGGEPHSEIYKTPFGL